MAGATLKAIDGAKKETIFTRGSLWKRADNHDVLSGKIPWQKAF
jgi:hypothetical protein